MSKMKNSTSSYRALNVSVGKVLIAAAWVDGEINQHEINCIKNIILRLPDISFEDWRKLKIYLAYPPNPPEQQSIIKNFSEKVFLKGHSKHAWSCLLDVLNADGNINVEEEDFAKELDSEMTESSSGILRKLKYYLLKSTIESQPGWQKKLEGRERFIHEFFDNPVYFVFRKALLTENISVVQSKPELQKICLFASILSWFAKLDGRLSACENDYIINALTEKCSLNIEVAKCMASVSNSVDLSELQLSNLCSSYAADSNREERDNLFKSIQKLVVMDNILTHEELECFRTLALYLEIPKDTWISCMKSIYLETQSFEE